MKPRTQPKAGKIKRFKEWLSVNGAIVLPAASLAEAVRFQTENGVSLIRASKHGTITAMTGDAGKAWDAFCRGLPWKGAHKTKRCKDPRKRMDMVIEIARRDGMTCAYCGTSLNIETATIEHVVPLALGGRNTLQNTVLACNPCNQEAGTMDVRQKIELAIVKRKQKELHHDQS